jgi:N-acetylneuraminic acid mutarotase
MQSTSIEHSTHRFIFPWSRRHEHQDAKEDEIWVYDPDCDSWTKYAKTPPRANLTSAICCQMQVNFDDEKVVKAYLKDK